MITKPFKIHQEHQHQQKNEYNSKEELSLIMSVASRKQDYAIQSIPHHIDHRKSAFNNYFNPTTPMAKTSNRFETQTLVSNEASLKVKATKTNEYCFVNNYHQNKTLFPRIIKNIIYKRLEQIFKNIHCMGIVSLNWNEKETDISVEEHFIEIKSMLISTAGKQSIRETEYTLQTNEKHFGNIATNVPIHNKLLLTEGKYLIRDCRGKQSRLNTPKK